MSYLVVTFVQEALKLWREFVKILGAQGLGGNMKNRHNARYTVVPVFTVSGPGSPQSSWSHPLFNTKSQSETILDPDAE